MTCQSLRNSALFARLSCLCGSALLMLPSLMCSDFRVPQSFPVDGHPGSAGGRRGLPRRTVRGSVNNSRTDGCKVVCMDRQLRTLGHAHISLVCCSCVFCAPDTNLCAIHAKRVTIMPKGQSPHPTERAAGGHADSSTQMLTLCSLSLSLSLCALAFVFPQTFNLRAASVESARKRFKVTGCAVRRRC
jgi:hypothetical protein